MKTIGRLEMGKRPLYIQIFGNEKERVERAKKEIEGIAEDIVEFLPDVIFDKRVPSDVSPYVDVKSEVVIPLLHGLDVEPFAYIGKPIVLWTDEGYYGAWTKDICSFLTLKGTEVYQFVTPLEAKETLKVLRARERMRKSKILYFGEMAGTTGHKSLSGVIGSDWNLERVKDVFGSIVKQISMNYLLKEIDEIELDTAKEEFKEWEDKVQDFGSIGKDEYLEVVKFYLAIKKILKEQDANALTINCLSDLFKRRFITPCQALAKLNDEDIPAGCEGDLNALLTMMIFHYITDSPSIMGNIYLFRPENGPGFPPLEVRLADTKEYLSQNKARFTHDVIPLRVAKGKYFLMRYHNTDRGITAYAELPKGEVTLARIGPKANRIVVTTAEIIEVESSGHCSFSAYLKMENLEEYLRQTSSLHNVITYGNHVSEIEKLGKILNLEVVKIK